eukprot:scaffold7225_cov379-Prasinococcus_capsulatus_cf.AAC.1
MPRGPRQAGAQAQQQQQQQAQQQQQQQARQPQGQPRPAVLVRTTLYSPARRATSSCGRIRAHPPQPEIPWGAVQAPALPPWPPQRLDGGGARTLVSLVLRCTWGRAGACALGRQSLRLRRPEH